MDMMVKKLTEYFGGNAVTYGYDLRGNKTHEGGAAYPLRYAYDAFGNTITKIGPMSDIFRHRFSTKYYDSETGLYYYGHRFYNPAVMRWINRDPIGESGGLNLYMFCNNNPMVHVDMIGYSVWDYVPFISTARAAIEVYIGHIPGSSATDYPFVSPKDCICDKINAEEECKEKVKIMSSQYAKEAIIKAMFAKIIDLYVAFNVIKAKPLISALFFADTLLNASLNAKAYSMVMIGTRDALKNNCSCSLFESQQED